MICWLFPKICFQAFCNEIIIKINKKVVFVFALIICRKHIFIKSQYNLNFKLNHICHMLNIFSSQSQCFNSQWRRNIILLIFNFQLYFYQKTIQNNISLKIKITVLMFSSKQLVLNSFGVSIGNLPA